MSTIPNPRPCQHSTGDRSLFSHFYLVPIPDNEPLLNSEETQAIYARITEDPTAKCSICLDYFQARTFTADCHHQFCRQCIKTWCHQLKALGKTPTCPYCRTVETQPYYSVRLRFHMDVECTCCVETKKIHAILHNYPDRYRTVPVNLTYLRKPIDHLYTGMVINPDCTIVGCNCRKRKSDGKSTERDTRLVFDSSLANLLPPTSRTVARLYRRNRRYSFS